MSSDIDHLALVEMGRSAFQPGLMDIFFLHPDTGDTVGFMRVLISEDIAHLHDIEVHPDYREQGMVRIMFHEVERYYGVEVIHEGGYTHMGFERIAHMFHSPDELNNMDRDYLFNDMTFIENWELLQPVHSL